MKIEAVICASGSGAYYHDDRAAISQGAQLDGFYYAGIPLTKGFSAIRIPAVSLSIGLVLDDGCIVWGDTASVQYAGAAGRDPLQSLTEIESTVESDLLAHLVGRTVNSFLQSEAVLHDSALPKSIAYGVSQALLKAAAHSRGCMPAAIVQEEFDFTSDWSRVPILAQCGDERYGNVDKMIMKRVEYLPHGLFNNAALLGASGTGLLEYLEWLSKRIASKREEAYGPAIYVDLYGTLTDLFGHDLDRMADFLGLAANAASPYALFVECPADFGSKSAQIEGLRDLRETLLGKSIPVSIVADEWCNTLEDIVDFAKAKAADVIQIKMPDLGSVGHSIRAIAACKAEGVKAYLGGTSAETDLSAALSVHVGIAAQADIMLAKPAMDVDAALTIVRNEQERVLAVDGYLRSKSFDDSNARRTACAQG